MEMDDRKSKVLQAIIDDYVSTAEPVGSRTIARKYQLGVSPATIRNEMADLEDLGYIEQPHTSAGRVPSNRGYRYYVDCLMEVHEVSPSEEDLIRVTFERRIREIDLLVRETARLLSETTQYASVVLGPQLATAKFRELHLVPMSGDRALLVYVTDTGFIENQVLELPVEVTMLELQRISGLLNTHLRGQSLEALSHGTLRDMREELRRYGNLLEQAMDFFNRSMEPGEKQRVYLGGATKMLSQPEFRDVDKVRSLLGILEQEDVVVDILGAQEGSGVSISIGEEIKVREMQECSMVSATYRIGDRTIGRLGVIGPKRMEYAKVVSLVDEVANRLNRNIDRNMR